MSLPSNQSIRPALAALLCLALASPALALLNSFETADGYAFPFATDVWRYDAGQTGAAFIPAQYNTGRWVELFGSSNPSTDSQYVSQHGYWTGGALGPPFALAVRSISPSTDGSFDMTVQYHVGADDLGIAPTVPLTSATIDFDICPGLTVLPGGGPDTVFNNVPAFSLSFGGTNTAPGLTVGFTDQDPANANRTRLTYIDGTTFNSVVVPWTGHFDHIQVAIDFVTQTYDLYWTADANGATPDFDAGNTPIPVVLGASMSNPVNTLEEFYFRAHTDPSAGTGVIGGLEKSYLDKFSIHPVPEPASMAWLAIGAMAMVRRGNKTGRHASTRSTAAGRSGGRPSK